MRKDYKEQAMANQDTVRRFRWNARFLAHRPVTSRGTVIVPMSDRLSMVNRISSIRRRRQPTSGAYGPGWLARVGPLLRVTLRFAHPRRPIRVRRAGVPPNQRLRSDDRIIPFAQRPEDEGLQCRRISFVC